MIDKISTDADYLTDTQVAQLLRAINPKRVGTYEKNSNLKLAHVEAYELRAHLNRILGFGRWSEDVTDQQVIYSRPEQRRRTDRQGNVQMKDGQPVTYMMWLVAYRSIVRLTVCAPSGKVLATYTEGAVGDATLSTEGDAHDMALKTSQSQAFKRCCANLGDQFGLSLYRKGSTSSLVKQTLLMPDVAPAKEGVDDDVEHSVPEDEAVEPTEDPRTTSQTPAAPGPQAPTAAGPVEGGVAPVAPPSTPPDDQHLTTVANEIREMALGKPEPGYSTHRWLAHVQGTAVKRGGAAILKVPVESSLSPTQVALKVFLEECLKGAMDREREARAS